MSRNPPKCQNERYQFSDRSGGKTSEDNDIADYIDLESESGKALKQMKVYDNSFTVKEFISGAKKAYEMIIVAFEGGDADKLRPLLLDEVFEAFSAVIDERADKGYTVELEFGGVREIRLKEVFI